MGEVDCGAIGSGLACRAIMKTRSRSKPLTVPSRVALGICLLLAATTSAELAYQKPPRAVLDVLNAPTPPAYFLSPSRDALLLMSPVRYPPISDLAQPMLRLAGARINPNTNAEHNGPHYSALALKRIPDGPETPVELPAGMKMSAFRWSADGKLLAFINVIATGVELWVVDVATAKARRMESVRINPMLESSINWMRDQKTLLVKLVPPGRGAPPPTPAVPNGPNTQQSSGEGGPSSTYEARDVLKDHHDEELFIYYGTSQLAAVDTATSKISPIGKPGLYQLVLLSPDGQNLLVETIHRPFSYLNAASRFPREVEVWNLKGELMHKLASLPLFDQVPINGVPTGARDYHWRPTQPATLVWAEALDGGDPKKKVPHRDRILTLKSPFTGAPAELFKTQERFTGAQFGEASGLVLITDYDRDRRWTRTFALNADDQTVAPRLIWDRSVSDRYNDPGYPVYRRLPNGASAIQQDGDSIYLSGMGSSPDGDRPFLDRLNLATLKTERLFRCDKTSYEIFIGWIDSTAGMFLTKRESPAMTPNFYLRTLDRRPVKQVEPGEASLSSTLRPFTKIPDPTPQLRRITQQLVKYKRADGVELSFTLYLPAGYKKGTRLPTVVWAYPLDYNDARVAGQVSGSPRHAMSIVGPSYLFFVLDGYAVIDPTMPVVGHPETAYDTFIEQLVANAKAAVDKAVEMQVTDPERVGVMGHSHGALMTATLLGHSDLFRAGVARSGAYNHVMRPFGFQNERRTLWEAQETYVKLSPVVYANKINKPLLLIHGEADVNPGTVPLQSERLYQAIRGTGGTVRLVMLPFESHGYSARESTEHTLWEMLSWFDKYVKKAAPRNGPQKLTRVVP